MIHGLIELVCIAAKNSKLDSENNPESALMNAPTDVRFLLSELDKRDECTKENPCRECLKMSVDGYKEIVRELEDENRKLLEERDEARSKAEEAWKEIDSLEDQLLSSQQEIERLREERDKLIKVLRWYADKTNYVQEVHHLRHGTLIGPAEAIYYDEGQRARDILKEIGANVE